MIAVAHEAVLDEQRGCSRHRGWRPGAAAQGGEGRMEHPSIQLTADRHGHLFDAATTARSWHKRRRHSLPEKPSRSIGRRLRADQAGASGKL